MLPQLESRHITAAGFPPSATPRLLHWLLEAGVDEFTVTVMGIAGEVAAHADAFEDALEPYGLGIARRRVLADADGPGSTRDVRIFRLDAASVGALLPFVKQGFFHNIPGPDGWLEDFAFYRRGELTLGVATHLQEGTLRLTSAEHAQVARMGIESAPSDEWVGY
jgi:hypothetical protein